MMSNTRTAIGVGAVALACILGSAQLVAAPKYEVVELAESGTIVGIVSFDGAAPAPQKITIPAGEDVCHSDPIVKEDVVVSADGKLRWAVVSLKKPAKGKAFPADDPEKPIVLDQVGCRFVPHVAVVPVGRTLRVLNSDGIQHNVHGKAKKNKPVNKSMPKQMKTLDLTFKRAERIPFVCDVHDWMKSWVIVSKHPYYAISAADGSFKLDQVPVGTHTVQLWHEKYGTLTQEVTVAAGKEARITFVVKPTEAAK